MIVLYIALAVLAFLFVIWVLYQLGAGPLMIAILDAIAEESSKAGKGGKGKGGGGGSWGGGGGFGGGGGGGSW